MSHIFPSLVAHRKDISAKNWIHIGVKCFIVINKVIKVLDCNLFDNFGVCYNESYLFEVKKTENPGRENETEYNEISFNFLCQLNSP